MKIKSENYGNQEEIDHLKKVVDMNTKELEKRDEELNAAQECIEIIHDKLKQILLRKFMEIIQKQLEYSKILATPRIGVDYAKEDALLPWRFCLELKKISFYEVFKK